MQQSPIQTNCSLVRQSREITESFPQLTKYPMKCWERFIGLLRLRYKEALTSRTEDGKKLTFSETLQMIRNLRFDPKTIDENHPGKVIDAANQIRKTSIVSFGSDTPSGVVLDKKGRFHATNLLADVNYQGNRLTLEFPSAILMHFFGKELTVEYDANIKQILKTKFGPILYQRCCILENRLRNEFEMSEDEIRLVLGIDIVSDPEKLKNHIIRERDKLDIVKGNEYDRFDDFYKRLVEPACAEINKLASEGFDIFCITPEIFTKSQHSRRRGAPSKQYTVKFKINSYVSCSKDNDAKIEDAEAIEITSESIIPPPLSSTQVQMELDFSDDSDLTKSLIQIRDKITTIFTASKATHTKMYVAGIIKQIKERYSVCHDLPSMVLAWISYCEKVVADKNGAIPEVSKLIQSNLKHHCQLFYRGTTYTGDKLPEYPPGFESTVICVNPSVGDNQTSQSLVSTKNI